MNDKTYKHSPLASTYFWNQMTKEPAHEIMVLITYATSKGSGEPVHARSLARAFAVLTQSMEVDEGSDQKSDI